MRRLKAQQFQNASQQTQRPLAEPAHASPVGLARRTNRQISCTARKPRYDRSDVDAEDSCTIDWSGPAGQRASHATFVSDKAAQKNRTLCRLASDGCFLGAHIRSRITQISAWTYRHDSDNTGAEHAVRHGQPAWDPSPACLASSHCNRPSAAPAGQEQTCT